MAQIVDLGYKAQATTSTLNKRQNDILGGNAKVSGCAPTAQATPSMRVDMKMGSDPSNVMYIGGVRVEETADVIAAWTIEAGTAGQTRYDLLCYRYIYGTTTATASPAVVKGTNGGQVPAAPDATYVAFGYVTVTGTPTSITQSMITAYPKTKFGGGGGATSVSAEWEAKDCVGSSTSNASNVSDTSTYSGQGRQSNASLAAGTLIVDGSTATPVKLRPFNYVMAVRLKASSNAAGTAVANVSAMFVPDGGSEQTLTTLSVLGTDFSAANAYEVMYLQFLVPSNGKIYPKVTIQGAATITVDSFVVTPIHIAYYGQ